MSNDIAAAPTPPAEAQVVSGGDDPQWFADALSAAGKSEPLPASGGFEEWFGAVWAGSDNIPVPEWRSEGWGRYIAQRQLALGAWEAALSAQPRQDDRCICEGVGWSNPQDHLPNCQHTAEVSTSAQPRPEPDGYHYRYPYGNDGSVIRKNNGEEVNGCRPLGSVPYWYAAPQPPSAPVGVDAIERDDGYDRTYIPLPGGWEVQTKGKGSTFRIAGPDDFRLAIPSSPYLHDTLEKMARDIHHALAQQPQPASAPTDDFNGDNAKLIDCIEALLSMDKDGVLVPHGIGGHARQLLSAAASRLAGHIIPTSAPVGVDRYDAGLLSDFGGGDVNWWQDYIRAELDRAHDFYTEALAQQPAAVDGVDWKAMYRIQTAMRYMDNMPDITRDAAFRMADQDCAGLEAQPQGADNDR